MELGQNACLYDIWNLAMSGRKVEFSFHYSGERYWALRALLLKARAVFHERASDLQGLLCSYDINRAPAACKKGTFMIIIGLIQPAY